MLIRRLLEKIFIIDLVIISPSMGDTMIWCILGRNYLLISDYELIFMLTGFSKGVRGI